MSQGSFASIIVISALALTSNLATATPAGALIQMNSTSTVGVLLDEIPAGPLREQAAANALAKPADFWIARARNQVRLMSYRLVSAAATTRTLQATARRPTARCRSRRVRLGS